MIVTLLQFGGSITSIPTHIITSVVTYYITKNFLLCYLFLATSSFIGTGACYWIYYNLWSEFFKKMETYPLAQVLKQKA